MVLTKSQGDIEVDHFRAPRHIIILLKSQKILCKGDSAPTAQCTPRRSKLLRSFHGL